MGGGESERGKDKGGECEYVWVERGRGSASEQTWESERGVCGNVRVRDGVRERSHGFQHLSRDNQTYILIYIASSQVCTKPWQPPPCVYLYHMYIFIYKRI